MRKAHKLKNQARTCHLKGWDSCEQSGQSWVEECGV